MLEAVQRLAPRLFSFVHSAYSSPSSLFWGDKVLQSAEGVQQGDPLGPLLFCLTIHQLCSKLKSELSLFYLDDGTLGGNEEMLRHDLEVVEWEGAELGLKLNHLKSEVICSVPDIRNSILSYLPGARVVDPGDAILLGSSIGDVTSISLSLSKKTQLLRKMGDRLQLLSTHDAILLLRHSLALPKLLYCLRTSPCFLSPLFQSYDDQLRSIVSAITNTYFGENDLAWTQASLPVKFGGLGIRCAVQLAPSAFLASAAASADLIPHLVPPRLRNSSTPHLEEARMQWSLGHGLSPPEGSAQQLHKAWDTLKASGIAESLLESAPDPRSRAHLLAASTKEAGAWLSALPISSLGLRMDDNTVRVAVGLRLGTSLCRPHLCAHCGAEVDCKATHGLSCRWSEGRHYRHAALNDIMHRALTSAHIPSRLEPSGIFRSDGKRPDGITMVPWENGKLLVWDTTCPDTFAPSYTAWATSEPGAVAALAEEKKRDKYAHLDPSHSFTPVAVETSGAIGPQLLAFLKDLGRRLRQVTGEDRAFSHLLQRVAVAVQRGNAASVMGTTGLMDYSFEFS